MRQIVIDTETTGMSPAQGHRIIEIAALELNNRIPWKVLHFRLDPEREVDAGAERVHGQTAAMLVGCQKFGEVALDVVDFLAGGEWIIHNAAFDLRFLDAEFSAHGLPLCAALHGGVIDTMALAREHSGGKRSLDALCDKFGIDRSKRETHGALVDVELLASVYLHMTRSQMTMDVALPAALIDPGAVVGAGLVIAPTAEELEAHAAYLAEMEQTFGKCVWRSLPAQ